MKKINIKINSKEVVNNDIFVAIRGDSFDGHDFINEAIENGASLIICEKCDFDFPHIIVRDTKEYLKEYIYKNYYAFVKDISLIGLTGTNGKTTTAYFIYDLLKKFNIKCAYIGTLGFYTDKKICDLNNTTPNIIELYNILIECKNSDIKTVVMEVSSHALDMDRVYGLKYDYVIFTNLTKDHLNYHLNMQNYLNAKRKLFNMKKENGIGIVNVDDKYGKYFLDDNCITYGFNKSIYNILNYKLYLNKIIYRFTYNNKKYKVHINMPGKYNIYNSLVAIIVLKEMGYSLYSIINKFKKIDVPRGRMEIIKNSNSFIIIDYAHTPDAVNNVLKSAQQFKKRKIYTIIGCGGDRDRSKRSEMANISVNMSDYVIFTSDNPRKENLKNIINDMICNLNKNNYEICLDRKDAIRKGIDLLEKNDILFILGKGHEEYQEIDNIKYHFNDKEEVLKYIKKL